jgi:ATP/maltotriose-dependent transcriptional regulator MalT
VILRLDPLSEPARSTLDAAAVVGMEFDLELVVGLAGEESGIEELLAGHVVFEVEPGTGAFRHTLIREAIRGEIAWSKRRSLHRRIAAYLQRAGAPPEQVTEHWLAAAEYEPARRALLELADRSCRLHAYGDAARAGQRALEIWPEGEEEEKRLEALERLAHCAQVSGQLGDAVRALREVADSPLVLGDDVRRGNVMRALATLYGLQGAGEQASESRTAAAKAYESAGEPAEAAVEWLAVAARHTANSALDHAVETIRRAGELAAGAGRPDVIVRAKAFEGNVLAMMGKAEEGRGLAQEALSIALDSSETEAAAEAFRRLASVLDYSSDFGGARDAYATAVDYCRTQGDDVNARVCLGCMSSIVYRTGDWKRALETCREVIDDPHSAPGSSSLAHGITGLIRAYRGETRPARKLLDESLARARQAEVAIVELLSRFGRALVAELDGDESGAAALHQDVLEGWRHTQDRHDLVPVFLWQSTFFARRSQERETTQRADALSTMASQTGNAEAMAALAHALGEVAGLAGQVGEAVTHFRQALAQSEKLEVPLEHAVTSWRLGVALARSGDREEAVRHLASAYRLARNLAARPFAALIAADLEACGERVEEGSQPAEAGLSGRGGLTRRQAEIVRLLADGLTNKEIAQKLFLSPRTIDMHVGHILERLDCRSRTEAARKAGELGLLD